MFIPNVGLLRLLVLGAVVIFGSTSMATDIDCEVRSDSCEYYLCHELKEPCGSKGYTIDFGYRYCLKYLDDDRYTEEGKTWLSLVRSCLQDQMFTLDQGLSCSETKTQAIKSHYGCYIDAGFCTLPLQDQRRILRTVGPGVLDPEIFLSGLEILGQCYKNGHIIW